MLYLIYRTFVALDIYRGSGAVNFMQTPSKHSMPRARGLLSRRHHKSFHAKINHFHWTPSTGKERDGGWRMEGSREKGRQRERGGSGRGVLTSEKHPEVNASPISPSLIVGCVHTNITNHYEGSIWFG